MLNFLLQVWTYVKKYWGILVAIVGFVLFKFWQQREQSDVTKILDDINKQHQKELEDIQRAHDLEEEQHRANEAKMEAALAAIEKQYEQAQQQLDAQKRLEIQQIIATTQDDPGLLAQKLSAATGFQVVLPEDVKQ